MASNRKRQMQQPEANEGLLRRKSLAICYLLHVAVLSQALTLSSTI